LIEESIVKFRVNSIYSVRYFTLSGALMAARIAVLLKPFLSRDQRRKGIPKLGLSAGVE
jgi:hypothetical protein